MLAYVPVIDENEEAVLPITLWGVALVALNLCLSGSRNKKLCPEGLSNNSTSKSSLNEIGQNMDRLEVRRLAAKLAVLGMASHKEYVDEDPSCHTCYLYLIISEL
ncbi:hypothetical protein CVS40_9508 [Lucilia cuprina]|nr:hypothetical protein CVS40_9508 [Lucilia cuprina]